MGCSARASISASSSQLCWYVYVVQSLLLVGCLECFYLILFPGPSYVPIKVRPPYKTSESDNSTPPAPRASSQPTAQPKRTISSKPSDIQQKGQEGVDAGLCPSLPNVGTYDAPAPQQGYPRPTYPGQQQYQAQGQVYQPSETSRLLSS